MEKCSTDRISVSCSPVPNLFKNSCSDENIFTRYKFDSKTYNNGRVSGSKKDYRYCYEQLSKIVPSLSEEDKSKILNIFL